MKEWIKEIQFVKEIASHLLLPRKTNYHQDFLLYKLSKNPHLIHNNFKTENQFKQILSATLIKHKNKQNDTCIIFLHGYGPNKQEGFTLIEYLPQQIDLCCFDFSSSGKSQGNITTYGLKEFRDIRTILNKLKTESLGYKKFILWGRSMGAVASFLMLCSQETIDRSLKKNIIFQVLDSPFCSFQSICSYQGKQSFKLPQLFINYGVQILKSHFKNHQPHLNPFNIDLVKVSHQCFGNTLFVYSEKDDMIPKENSLSLIERLPTSTNYEKLLIHENHNTLRTDTTNQQIFKIITKNYFKHLYKEQKIKCPKLEIQQKQKVFQINSNAKQLNKIQSEIHFHRKNSFSLVHLQNNPTQQTANNESHREPIKKQKKYLELLSSLDTKRKKTTKNKPEIKKICFDTRQFQSYRNMITKGTKKQKIIKQFTMQCIDDEYTYQHKNTINSINSFKDIHQLCRSNSFECPEVFQQGQQVEVCQPFQKVKNYQSNLSTTMKTSHLEDGLNYNNKTKKRALYCSLNKHYALSKPFVKQSKNQKAVNGITPVDNSQDSY